MKNIVFGFFLFMICATINLSAQSTFRSETLQNAITQYVKQQNKCESEVEISQQIKELKFAQSGVKASISHTDDLAGLCKVNIDFLIDGKSIHSETIRIKVKLFAKVPIAVRFIPKDNIIGESDITMQMAEVTNIDPNAVPTINDAVGTKSKKGIAKGSVVQYSEIMSASSIYVNKNDKVKLFHYSGSICIKTDGIALEAGGAGTVIKVKSNEGQSLYGFVADDGNVIIEDKQILGRK
jgi:flagella basal body P-ring formation protein FlgA